MTLKNSEELGYKLNWINMSASQGVEYVWLREKYLCAVIRVYEMP